jgi:hypothetical protein
LTKPRSFTPQRAEIFSAARAAKSMIENHGKRALLVAERRAASAEHADAAMRWREIADAIRQQMRTPSV